LPSVAATEVGALQVNSLAVETTSERSALRQLVAKVFDSAPDSALVRAFFPALCQRFAQKSLYTMPVRRRARQAFPESEVDEIGFDAGVSRRPVPLLPAVEAFVAGELTRLARSRASRRGTWAALSAPRDRSPVDVWLALIPDWARINAHVIDSVAAPLLTEGRRIGVVLVGTLNTGVRSEQTMRAEGSKPLTGLMGLEATASRLEQAVLPRSRRAFLMASGRATALAGRAALRLEALRGELRDLTGNVMAPGDAARWLGVDLLRYELARAATHELARSIETGGQTFVFAASSSPALAAVDLELQRHGARTIHLFHGGLGDDWIGAAEHCSTLHGAWTENDRRCLQSLRGGVVVGGMPVRLRQRERKPVPKSILVMTSYLHRDYVGVRDLDLFEEELVAFMIQLRSSAVTRELEVRWRPHPGSLDRKLAPLVKRLEPLGVHVSRGRTLAADVDEADLVVSNMSTVIAEAVLTGLPIFVHVMPLHWAAPAADFVHPDRAFFRATDGAALIERYVERAKAGAVDPVPEAFMRERLFGPTGRPQPLNVARLQ
jgi:hypothetical protein